MIKLYEIHFCVWHAFDASQYTSSKVSPKNLKHVWFSLLSPVFTLLPQQHGCVTTSSCAAKTAGCASTTSTAAVPQPTRACSVRSPAASRSWVAAGAPIRARPRWRLRPPPGWCCCCWARHCWERPPAGPPCSKETSDLVGVKNLPTASTLTFPPPLSNNQQPLNKNHELSGPYCTELLRRQTLWTLALTIKGMCQTHECKNFSFNFKEYIEMKKTYTSKNARYY